jgi:DNA-damage-inducible protein J
MTVNINIRTNAELKSNAQKILNQLGMDMTTAFNLYLVQIVRQKRIPFELSVVDLADEWQKHLEQSRNRKGKSLEQILTERGWDGTQAQSEEIDWGSPVGEEVW